MIKTVLITCLSLALCPGCVFSKRSGKPKANISIAGEVQETLRKRWVDQRVAELVSQGAVADAARTQAEAEFRVAYNFPDKPGRK
jgi:hypothetical protein